LSHSETMAPCPAKNDHCRKNSSPLPPNRSRSQTRKKIRHIVLPQCYSGNSQLELDSAESLTDRYHNLLRSSQKSRTQINCCQFTFIHTAGIKASNRNVFPKDSMDSSAPLVPLFYYVKALIFSGFHRHGNDDTGNV